MMPSVADEVRGEYPDHASLMPILLDDGDYALPVDTLLNPAFMRIIGILKECEIREVEINNENQ